MTHNTDSLEHLKAQGLLRWRTPWMAREGVKVQLDQPDHPGHPVSALCFCSNDYLGLASDPRLQAAMIEGMKRYGLGSGASPLISGYCTAQAHFEHAMAAHLHRERALFFNSGYMANLGVLPALANRHSWILSDKLCHASLLDGIALSRARHLRYHHQDLHHLESLLKKLPPQPLHHTPPVPIWIVTESCFSMQGDLTPLPEIAALAAQYGAKLLVDDAHGFGILNPPSPAYPITCLVTPLGKSLGLMGAMVSGSNLLIERILQTSRPYRYSTALPPALAIAGLKALEILAHEPWRQTTVLAHARYLQTQLQQRGLFTAKSPPPQIPMPICILPIPSPHHAQSLQHQLLERGVWVAVIRPPTVPLHQSCIRISLSALHTHAELDLLLAALQAVL